LATFFITRPLFDTADNRSWVDINLNRYGYQTIHHDRIGGFSLGTGTANQRAQCCGRVRAFFLFVRAAPDFMTSLRTFGSGYPANRSGKDS